MCLCCTSDETEKLPETQRSHFRPSQSGRIQSVFTAAQRQCTGKTTPTLLFVEVTGHLLLVFVVRVYGMRPSRPHCSLPFFCLGRCPRAAGRQQRRGSVSILFHRPKILFFTLPRGWQHPNSHKLEAQSKSQYTVHNRGPRGTANAQRSFYWWAKYRCTRVPSQVCCGKVAL